MEWDDLKHFLAVARAGSLADAARILKTSPATIGRRIAALEASLGARLFDRNQAGYSLTKTGEAIRAGAGEVEEAVSKVERQVLGRDMRPAGKVRLATVNEIAAHVVAPQLGELRRDYPDVVLEVVEARDLINLTRRDADIALRTVRPEHGDLLFRRAGSWKSGLYAAKSYVEAHSLKPGLADFSGLDIITWTEECAHLPGGPWFAEHARGSNVAFEANSRHIHYSACKTGIGLAILPCLPADRDPDLVRLLPPERVISADLYLLVHRDLNATARVRAVLDFLCERIAKYTR